MYDVGIIGSGFGGSVSALLLAKLGYKVLLLERGKHPRFAIGESTTPVMSKKIRHLGKIYDIPELIDLSSYDHIKKADLPITCGPKELFHYFWQEEGQETAEINGEAREIVVRTPEVDSQLFRGDSDKYLVDVAVKYGTEYRDETSVEDIDFKDDKVDIMCECLKSGEKIKFETKFIIDGTGFKSLISKKFNLAVPKEEMDIPLNSRSIFTHFNDIGEFEEVAHASADFKQRPPVGRERATQHHCFDGGWYWVIPFANGVTSVGVNLDIDKFGINDKPAEEEFWEITNKFPIVKKMLQGKTTNFPFIKTGRIQFQTKAAAGDRWAMLPASATGGDAWFSTGLGFTLMCAHRIVDLLHTEVLANNNFDKAVFANYEKALFKEWSTVCRMIDCIYKSFKHFEVFKYYCFFCFMGAETFVHRGGVTRPHDMKSLLLNAGDEKFVARFEEFYSLVKELYTKDSVPQETIAYMKNFVRNEMAEYNYRDYGNDETEGMYDRISSEIMDMRANGKCPSQKNKNVDEKLSAIA